MAIAALALSVLAMIMLAYMTWATRVFFRVILNRQRKDRETHTAAIAGLLVRTDRDRRRTFANQWRANGRIGALERYKADKDALAVVRAIMETLKPLPPARKPLDLEERSNMQGRWATEHCQTCGYLHFGVCPRIARIVTERKGAQVVTVTTEYWPDGQWKLPEWHLSVGDVFDDNTPTVPKPEESNDG